MNPTVKIPTEQDIKPYENADEWLDCNLWEALARYALNQIDSQWELHRGRTKYSLAIEALKKGKPSHFWTGRGWPEDFDGHWFLFYTNNRDSGLLEESNAAQYAKLLDKLAETSDNVKPRRDSSDLIGWIEGYLIRVTTPDGWMTFEFAELADMILKQEYYPALNEDDYCQREDDILWENLGQTIENVYNKVGYMPESRDYDYKEDDLDNASVSLTGLVYEWLSANSPRDLESIDDRGAWPDYKNVISALIDLGYAVPIKKEEGD